MITYNINKGIGRTVEFKGLKAQYLFIFAGGLLGILVFIMIMYIVGVHTYVCLFLGGSSAGLLIWQTFSLNRKYGEHGLMKVGAKKKHPKYIISRKSLFRYVKVNSKKVAA
ncbi:DUF4133 domain-containing protein [Chryseobacterium sp. Ch-15]|uniref:DUF4133 domain-containing protein n=1 Tax=Chryseobacterium muglaense TaxID=2893752 RepID=A0A9Q3UT22_9FLAO|nr:DUF4133 domain-containing protein [Chryseobacterium muglaense]MBD3906076.1 DUF4133 domain-containing protein [Chryseobacterium muglaense]MCC9032986.1 DUF4133 domain-containing protein [Chryseobacterium muglaense]MCM2556566.1 DUF4133 domain-containing protein [Chryseobacterium muglaense]